MVIDMKNNNKTTIIKRTGDILRSNDGTSIVLVTIIAIIIVACVIILRIATSSLWASADRQYYQDQAYLLATSMGASIDDLVVNGEIDLSEYGSSTSPTISPLPAPSGIPNSSVVVDIASSTNAMTTGYTVTVTAKVANATYIYTAYYTRNKSGTYMRQFI